MTSVYIHYTFVIRCYQYLCGNLLDPQLGSERQGQALVDRDPAGAFTEDGGAALFVET